MKIAVVGDLHLGKSARGLDRTPEIVERWNEIVEEARRQGCDVLVQTGDVFDASAPSPDLTALGVRLFLEAAPRFPGGVYVMPGNHDLRHGHDRTDTLAPLRAAIADARVEVECPSEPTIFNLYSAPLPATLPATETVARLLLLPYESKSRRGWNTAEEYDEIIRGLVPDDGIPLVVVGHCDLDGAELASEILSRGGGHPWPEGRGWQHLVTVAIDGHYHKPQMVRVGRWEIECVGTPVVLDFGEEHDSKRWLIVEV